MRGVIENMVIMVTQWCFENRFSYLLLFFRTCQRSDSCTQSPVVFSRISLTSSAKIISPVYMINSQGVYHNLIVCVFCGSYLPRSFHIYMWMQLYLGTYLDVASHGNVKEVSDYHHMQHTLLSMHSRWSHFLLECRYNTFGPLRREPHFT